MMAGQACKTALLLAFLMLASGAAGQRAVSGTNIILDPSLVVQQANLAYVGGTWSNTQSLDGLSSLANGLLGLWRFDTLSSTPRDGGSVVVNRTTSPAAVGGVPATITGTGPDAPLMQGKFGQALKIAPYGRSWAQIFPGPWPATAPTTGFSVALWYMPLSTSTSQGHLMERQWDNFNLNVNGPYLSCVLRTQSAFITLDAPGTFAANTWAHVACTYSAATRQATLYVGGAAVASATVAFDGGLFLHGDGQPLGIGDRPGTLSNLAQYKEDAVQAAVDELGTWGRPLSAAEVAALATSNAPLALATATGFTTYNLFRGGVSEQDSEFEAVTLSWALDAGTSAQAVEVAVSTDGGLTWCQVVSGLAFTDNLHGGSQELCTFPATRVAVKATWRSSARMSGLTLQLHSQAPARPAAPLLRVGLNLEGVTYYSSAWTFVDLMQGSAGSSWPTIIRSGVDRDGYPLELTANDQPTSTFWVPGRVIYSTQSAGLPSGDYTFLATGTGSVTFSGNVQPRTLNLPLPNPSAGVQLRVDASQDVLMLVGPSKLGDPVKGWRLLLPGVNPADTSLSARFHPTFLQRMGQAKLLRTMDWGRTNDNRLASWAHRSMPASISQTADVRIQATISTATCYTPQSRAYVNEAPAILVRTQGPHGFATGQPVTIINSRGWLVTTRGRNITFNSVQGYPVEVLSADSFVVSLRDWSFAANEGLRSCAPASATNTGSAVVVTPQGVAYELMAALANAKGADLWVCVPLLADDGYVREMANLLKAQVQGKVYVEYSNEVWNGAFSAYRHAASMARVLGLNGASGEDGQGHLRYYGYRARQIFSIFRDVWGSAAPSRLVRVVAVQAGTGDAEMRAVGAGNADALAIAPYFNVDQAELLAAAGSNPSFDIGSILDGCRGHIAGTLRRGVRASKAVANSYGLRLIAYEGGQHLGGPDWRCPGGCENQAAMQSAFQQANRSWRMRGLYDNLFRMWAAEGGAEFAVFTYTGPFSKWGSWGLLERQDQDPNTAPKYQAVMQYIAAEAAASG